MSEANGGALVESSARALYGVIGGAAHAAVAIAAALRGHARAEASLDERLGLYPPTDGGAQTRESIWVHAASVGELRAVEALLARIKARVGEAQRIVLTCQTATGRALASTFGADEVRFAPLDSERAVTRALRRFQPALFVLVETEVWPRLLAALARASVPATMVSARVSARSFARYRLARGLFAPPLATLARVCARDEESAERLVHLGARAEVTSVCGDLKLDALDDAIVAETPAALDTRAEGRRQLLAISTHAGEDEVVLDAFARLGPTRPGVRLVLAPRHPDRCTDVVALAERSFRTVRWSSQPPPDDASWEVLVVDTTGELRRFMKTASAGFVGGSLVPVGGHNLAEPAAFGVPVATGPLLGNVTHQAEALERAGALVVVRDAVELARIWSQWLDDAGEARRVATAAHTAFASSRGALARTLAALEPLLARLETRRPELR